MVSLQFGMYAMMIDNTLAVFTGHLQVQAPGYKDEKKMRQSIPDAVQLGKSLRDNLKLDAIAVRAAAFALASSEERSFGIQVIGVQPEFEPQVSSLPGVHWLFMKNGRKQRDSIINAVCNDFFINTVLIEYDIH